MAQFDAEHGEVRARIVYWGVEGAGKSTNVRTIYARLRPDRRGELREVPTRLDPTVSYELLPIELGEVQGHRTQLQVIAVPGAPEQAPTRTQLLDQTDGVVLVVDSQGDRIEENVAAVAELREALAAYGRVLEDLPVVVQYNKRDLADPYGIEELHRRLGLGASAVFEAVAHEGTGVLQTLTTISKRVVRILRESDPASAPPPEPAPAAVVEPEPAAPTRDPSVSAIMEAAILAEGEDAAEAQAIDSTVREAQTLLDPPGTGPEPTNKSAGVRIGADLRIASVGQAERIGERSLRLPLVLGNDDGETATLALTIQLDPLLDDEPT